MTDTIEKTVLLQAPLDRVWQAVSESGRFGTWFGCEIDGAFEAGKRLQCRIHPTQVDAQIAKAQEQWAGMPFEIEVERVEPMKVLTFKWHPGAEAPKDGSEPMTTVTFEMSEASGGVLLKITESGFDQIPLARRAKAFADNEGGWEAQCELIQTYLAKAA